MTGRWWLPVVQTCVFESPVSPTGGNSTRCVGIIAMSAALRFRLSTGHSSLLVATTGRFDSGTAERKNAPWYYRNSMESCGPSHFSPDGKLIAASGGDRSGGGPVKIWDVRSGRCLKTLGGSNDRTVWSVCFSPDGTKLATAGHQIIVWDAGTHEKLSVLDEPGDEGRDVAFLYRRRPPRFRWQGRKDKSMERRNVGHPQCS